MRVDKRARAWTRQTHTPTQAQTHHSPIHMSTTKPLPAPPRLQSFFPTSASRLSSRRICPESYLAAVKAVAVEGSTAEVCLSYCFVYI